MAEIKSGLLIDGQVKQSIVANIERPGLDFKKIRAIIIHQTDSQNAAGTMNWWKQSPNGAHFIIDRRSGTFLQTKNIGTKKNPIWKYTGKTVSYDGSDGQIHQTAHLNKRCNHAGKLRDKKYPDNYDSIGIEFVSKYDEIKQLYPLVSPKQIESGAWLVKTLLELITTIPSMEAVYAHGVIAFKTEDQTEGGTTLDALKNELTVESSCPEIIQQLFPCLCGFLEAVSPKK